MNLTCKQKRNDEFFQNLTRIKMNYVFTEMYETKMNELKEKFEKLSAETENMVTEDINEPLIDSAGFTYEDNFNQEGENQTTDTESKGE